MWWIQSSARSQEMWVTSDFFVSFLIHKTALCNVHPWYSQSVGSSDTSQLTLDPNTAHIDLTLAEGNRKATRWTKQPYADHPERFDFSRQVLCREGLTGRCYWETEWSGRALMGVAYRRMCRKGEGDECRLGRNDSSWGLNCNKDGYRAFHKGVSIAINIPSSSNKVGVYLDWSAGAVSFFRVSCGALTLLHTFHTTFTEPVYPGFHLGWVDSTVYLC